MVATGDVVRLRRMVAEPTEAVYTDEDLEELISLKPINDSDGLEPDNDSWVETYDLFAVASEIWMEKAGALSEEFDFSADGGNFSRSQKYQFAVKQSLYYKSRSSAYSFQMKQSPITTGFDMPYKDDPHDEIFY